MDNETPQPEAAAPPTAQRMKRVDLLDAVASKVALSRSDARLFLEVVLAELGRAVDTHDEVVLPPFGKLKVKSRAPRADGSTMLTVKLKRFARGEADGAIVANAPLAERDKDG